MNKFLLILISFFMTSVQLVHAYRNGMNADEFNNYCREQGNQISNSSIVESGTTALSRIDILCTHHVVRNSKGELYSKADEAGVNAYAGFNFIIIEKKQKDKNKFKKFLIAGPNANLGKILSIDLSKDGEHIAVLHQLSKGFNITNPEAAKKGESQIKAVKEIRVFSTNKSGNFIPVKILRSEEINYAVSVSYDLNIKNNLFIADEKNGHIYTFSTLTDYRESRKKLIPKPLNKISVSSFRVPSSIDIKQGNEVLFLDKERSEVVSINAINNETNWVLTKDEIKLNNVIALRYNDHSGELILTNQKGKEVIFQLVADGGEHE